MRISRSGAVTRKLNCAQSPEAAHPNTIDRKSAIFFVNQLRSARLVALADAEAFDEIIHAVERLGSFLTGKQSTLGNYREELTNLARISWLAEEIPNRFRGLAMPFDGLFRLVRVARNDALHQGAFARHLTKHSIELALVLEDALTKEKEPVVSDFMVRNPICAELWHPVSFIRQQMLANSYSSLPVPGEDGEWTIVSDVAIADYLSSAAVESERNDRLAKPLRRPERNPS
jgi:hypothetical protein